MVARHQGDWTAALSFAKASHRHSIKLDNSTAIAVALNNLALTLGFFGGQYDDAIRLNKQSINLLENLNALPELCMGYTFQAEFYRNQGKLTKAKQHTKNGIALAKQGKLTQRLATLLFFEGWTLISSPSDQKGWQLLTEADQLLKQVEAYPAGNPTASFFAYALGKTGNSHQAKQAVLQELKRCLDQRAYFQIQYPLLTILLILLEDLESMDGEEDQSLLNISSTLHTTLRQFPFNRAPLNYYPLFQLIRDWEAKLSENLRPLALEANSWKIAEEILDKLPSYGWPIVEESIQEVDLTNNNLPPQPTPFLGRQQEINTLTNYLADPDKQLITIIGSGGMGKTRLALAVAEQQLAQTQFPNGIYFVPLAPLSDADPNHPHAGRSP